MVERLSFYLDRPSVLHRLNPTTKLSVAFTLILIAFLGKGLWLPSLIFLLILTPLSLLGQVGREFLGTTLRLLLPLFAFLFVMQSLFYPGGRTVLFSLWVFSVKLEGVQFAFLTATRILVMVCSFLLLLLTTHPGVLLLDLTRRGLPASVAYILASTLQIIPQMRAKAATILDAQRSRGLRTGGNLLQRIRALLPLVGPLVFASLVDVEERAIAIEARGFHAARRKTSLVEIEDRPLERALRWLCLVALLLAIVSSLWR